MNRKKTKADKKGERRMKREAKDEQKNQTRIAKAM
jgi:hypothetical protein